MTAARPTPVNPDPFDRITRIAMMVLGLPVLVSGLLIVVPGFALVLFGAWLCGAGAGRHDPRPQDASPADADWGDGK